MITSLQPGKLVSLRGRDWIVLPSDDPDLLVVKPLGGSDDEIAGIYLPLGIESDQPVDATFPSPTNGNPALLYGIFASFVFDYLAKQKLSGLSFSYFILKQIPVLPPENLERSAIGALPLSRFVLPRVLELTYSAWDLESFGRDYGWSGPPFRWDQERRFQLRCELDAAFFHLYLGSDEEWTVNPRA